MKLLLGEHLLKKNAISKKVLEHCLNVQDRTQEKLGQILLHYNLISEEDLAQVLATQAGMDYWDKPISHTDITGFDVFSQDLCKEHSMISVRIDSKDYLLLADPFNKVANQEFRAKRLNGITRMVAQRTAINVALSTFVPSTEKGKAKIEELIKKVMSGGISAGAMQELAFVLIEEAANQDGSDIHIEPTRKTSDIRFRIDGMLQPVACLPLKTHANLINVFYSLAGITAAEFAKFHDSSFAFSTLESKVGAKASGKQIDIRLSSLPSSTGGAGLCLRILNKEKTFIPLESLGYSEFASSKIKKIIAKPHGLVLFTGPTGSGKTTTLYAILSELRDETRKIITIEDPVEIELPLISQIEVNEKAAKAEDRITFSSAIRVFLRHDPDIILVGEIRDLETAQEALRAAFTGHQTFSTLHATDAFNCLTRLLDLGMSLQFLAQGLTGLISQRLVRKLCQHCRKKGPALDKYRTVFPGEVYYPVGCEFCRDGYHGRTVAAEVLEITPEIRDKMVLGELADVKRVVENMKKNKEFCTLQEDALRLIEDGITSITEIERVVGIEL